MAHFNNRNLPLYFGCAMLLVSLLVAVFAPLLATHDPLAVNTAEKLETSSLNHYLGTDFWGRDIYSRILYGARYSLTIAFSAISISMMAGLFVGTVAGYYSDSKIATVIVWGTDILMCFPTLILGAMVAMVFGPGMINTILAIGVAFFPRFIRLARGTALSIKEELFIKAAQSIGMSTWRLFVIHLIPNVISPLIVMAIVWTSIAIITEVGLSFLGLGVPPPTASWGNILLDNLRYFRMRPAHVIWPSIAIAFTVQALNLIGDRFRDIMDPKMR